jgi:YHS domain-containing protein
MKILAKNKPSTIDPVCGMHVDPSTTALLETVQGHTYHFCTEGCRTAFNENPTLFLDNNKIVKKRKSWWGRYLARLQKTTHGQPPKCC